MHSQIALPPAMPCGAPEERNTPPLCIKCPFSFPIVPSLWNEKHAIYNREIDTPIYIYTYIYTPWTSLGFLSAYAKKIQFTFRVLRMAKKRKSDATRLDEVDRGMYTAFCSAANSLSQLYSQAVHQQRLSFQAGERHAMVCFRCVIPFLCRLLIFFFVDFWWVFVNCAVI